MHRAPCTFPGSPCRSCWKERQYLVVGGCLAGADGGARLQGLGDWAPGLARPPWTTAAGVAVGLAKTTCPGVVRNGLSVRTRVQLNPACLLKKTGRCCHLAIYRVDDGAGCAILGIHVLFCRRRRSLIAFVEASILTRIKVQCSDNHPACHSGVVCIALFDQLNLGVCTSSTNLRFIHPSCLCMQPPDHLPLLDTAWM